MVREKSPAPSKKKIQAKGGVVCCDGVDGVDGVGDYPRTLLCA